MKQIITDLLLYMLLIVTYILYQMVESNKLVRAQYTYEKNNSLQHFVLQLILSNKRRSDIFCMKQFFPLIGNNNKKG